MNILDRLENFLTPKMKLWCELEESLFYLLNDNKQKAKELLKRFDQEDKDSLFQLIITAALSVQMNYNNYAEIWRLLGEPNHTYDNTFFVEFLVHKGILDKYYLEWPSNTQSLDDLEEMLYGKDTIEYALVKHDFDTVVFLSATMKQNDKIYYKYNPVSLLDFAALSGDFKSFQYFIINGSKLDNESCKYAIMGGNMSIIELYIQQEFNFMNHITTIISYNRNYLFKWLIGSNDNFTCKIDNVLQISCDAHNTFSFMFFAIQMQDEELDRSDSMKWTPLLTASYNGCIEEVKFLLKKHVDVNRISIQGTTSIELAAKKGFFSIFRYLREAGAILLFSTPRRNTLQMATKIRYTKMCIEILKMNPDLNTITKSSSFQQLIKLLQKYLENEDDPFVSSFLINHPVDSN